MDDLTGRVALVTGGSPGIGAATSQRLADAVAVSALTYVQAAEAREVADRSHSLGTLRHGEVAGLEHARSR